MQYYLKPACFYQFIFYTAYSTQGHRKPGVYPKELRAQGTLDKVPT